MSGKQPTSPQEPSEQLVLTAEDFMPAHLTRWARRAYWRPAEIAALSFGKDPRWLNLDSLSSQRMTNPFAMEFWDRCDLVIRAADAGQIVHQCSPEKAIEWMDRFGLPYPDELKVEVLRFYPLTDYKTAFLSLLQKNIANEEKISALLDQMDGIETPNKSDTPHLFAWSELAVETLTELMREKGELEQKLAIMRETEQSKNHAQPAANDNSGEPEHPRIQASKDIIMATMVIRGYGLTENPKRTSVFKDIESDAAQLGIGLGYETIKRHLTNAIRNAKPVFPRIDS